MTSPTVCVASRARRVHARGVPAHLVVAGEGIRFAVVGGVATVVSTTAFNLLVHWSPLGRACSRTSR